MDMYYVTIPAYQPDEKLIQLLKGIKNRLNCQVIVVDDGSSGESVEILEAARQYATVLNTISERAVSDIVYIDY